MLPVDVMLAVTGVTAATASISELFAKEHDDTKSPEFAQGGTQIDIVVNWSEELKSLISAGRP
jgi:hypothetical protein